MVSAHVMPHFGLVAQIIKFSKPSRTLLLCLNRSMQNFCHIKKSNNNISNNLKHQKLKNTINVSLSLTHCVLLATRSLTRPNSSMVIRSR